MTDEELRERVRRQYGEGIPARSFREERERTAPTLAPVLPPRGRVLVALDYAVRDGDRLRLELPFPPRTKKNHGQAFGIRQSKGYIRFREQVKDHVGRMKDALQLPLPDAIDFNAAARFYVDNDAADTVGLMQGLADALQDAGVIPNDRQLRTWNGTDQEPDKVRPRVELLLTPILRAP